MAKKKTATTEKDQYFKGMEPVTIAELEKAAEDYEFAKEQHKLTGERVEDAEGQLMNMLSRHAKAKTVGMAKTVDGQPRYHARGIHRIVELKQQGGLKVKVKKEPKPAKPEA